ncbi:hypothetical protein HZS_8062 [Henneguya salminicola]|nr:hypothetical protein HZS_8062 [Henneguya salminicola]
MPYPFPRSASDLIIPNEFKNTFREEPFAVSDIFLNQESELLFASRRNKNYFSIYFDATFKTAPQIFSQLFTVHATEFTITIPCVYALMQQKN